MCVIILIRWSLGIISGTRTNLICILFKKAFTPAWTFEETESVLLNLGKCWKPKGTHKPRMQKRGDKKKPNQRESTHINNINVKVWLVAFIVVVSHNLLVKLIQRERKKLRPRCWNGKLSQPWKQMQEERKKLRSRQLKGKLSQPRKQTQGERVIIVHAAKCQSETPQNVEKRRQQDSWAKIKEIAHSCIYMTLLLIYPLFQTREHALETEQAKTKWKPQKNTAKKQQWTKQHLATNHHLYNNMYVSASLKRTPDTMQTLH